MTRLTEVEAHIVSMSELSDIIGAMRSLASMRMQEAHRALPHIRRYAETMAASIGASLLLLPDARVMSRRTTGRRAFVLYMAEHGFVGGFNERILNAAKGMLVPNDAIFVLGSRGVVLALVSARHRGGAEVLQPTGK